MKTVLAAACLALLVSGGPGFCVTPEIEELEAPQDTEEAQPEAPPSVPAEQAKPADPTSQGHQPDDGTDQPSDTMNNVTRHRPGACPEGPPCKKDD